MLKNKYFLYEDAKKWVLNNTPQNINTLKKLYNWIRENESIVPKELPTIVHEFYNIKRHGGWTCSGDFFEKRAKRYCAKYKVDDDSINERKIKIISFYETNDFENKSSYQN